MSLKKQNSVYSPRPAQPAFTMPPCHPATRPFAGCPPLPATSRPPHRLGQIQKSFHSRPPTLPSARPRWPDSRASYSCGGDCTVRASPLHSPQGTAVLGPTPAVVGGDRDTTLPPVASLARSHAVAQRWVGRVRRGRGSRSLRCEEGNRNASTLLAIYRSPYAGAVAERNRSVTEVRWGRVSSKQVSD